MKLLELTLGLMCAVQTALCATCPSSCQCSAELHQVDCSWANLSYVPDTQGVHFLDLNNNNLTELSITENCSTLEYLDVSSSLVESVGTLSCPVLRTLHLHNNKISAVQAESFRELTALTILDLMNNAISLVQDDVFAELSSLELLDLSGNQISTIGEDALAGLESLRHLKLDSNRLSSLPSFAHVPYLSSLSVSHNLLTSLPDSAFSSLASLKSLSASHNEIVEVSPTAFQQPDSLRVPLLQNLYLQYNRLSEVPSAALNTLGILEVIDLSGNLLTEVGPDSFSGSHLRRLQSIYMNFMPLLTHVQENAFYDMPSLELLHMHSCPLLSVFNVSAIHNCPNFRELDLHACGLIALSQGIISDWSSVEFLDVRYNAFFCDCYLAWLKKRLRSLVKLKSSEDFVQQVRCTEPASLKDKPLVDIATYMLPCNNSNKVDQHFEDRIMIAIFTSTCFVLLAVGGALMYKYRHSMCEQTQPGVDVYSYFVYHNPNRLARHHKIPPRRLQAKPRDPNRSLRHVTWSSTDIEPYRPKKAPSNVPPQESLPLAAQGSASTAPPTPAPSSPAPTQQSQPNGEV